MSADTWKMSKERLLQECALRLFISATEAMVMKGEQEFRREAFRAWERAGIFVDKEIGYDE